MLPVRLAEPQPNEQAALLGRCPVPGADEFRYGLLEVSRSSTHARTAQEVRLEALKAGSWRRPARAPHADGVARDRGAELFSLER